MQEADENGEPLYEQTPSNLEQEVDPDTGAFRTGPIPLSARTGPIPLGERLSLDRAW